MRILISLFGIVLLAGCAARYPEPIRTDAQQLVDFRQALLQPEQHTGNTARWGGVIAEITNTAEQTRIEVVNFPLNHYGRPQVDDRTPGRFVVYLNEFVDPEIYRRGRNITALGTFTELEEGAIGDYVYLFPVVQASGVELWQPRQQQPAQIGISYGFHSGFSNWHLRGLYGPAPYRYYPYFHPYYYPYAVRVPQLESRQISPQQLQPQRDTRNNSRRKQEGVRPIRMQEQ